MISDRPVENHAAIPLLDRVEHCLNQLIGGLLQGMTQRCGDQPFGQPLARLRSNIPADEADPAPLRLGRLVQRL